MESKARWQDIAGLGDLLKDTSNARFKIVGKYDGYFWVTPLDPRSGVHPFTVIYAYQYDLVVPEFEVGKRYRLKTTSVIDYEVALKRDGFTLLIWTHNGLKRSEWISDNCISAYREI